MNGRRFLGIIIILVSVIILYFPDFLILNYGLTLQYARIVGVGLLVVGLCCAITTHKSPHEIWDKKREKEYF
jgi:hypothetical protein